MRSRSTTLVLVFSLAIACGAVYWPVSHHPFIDFDDPLYVTDNPWVSGGMRWAGVRWAGTAVVASNWHPLTLVSHMADVSLFGMHPGGHHLVSVLIHACNAILLMLILKKITGSLWRSAFVAALFAVHPLHVESVAWIAERKDVLSTFFALLSVNCYVDHRRRPSTVNYLAVVVLFAASLMAKPMLVTLPFLLLLLDFWPLGHLSIPGSPTSSREVSPARGRWASSAVTIRPFVEKLPLLLLSVASSIVTLFAQKSEGAIKALEAFPFPVRVANAVVSYSTYLRKTFWPTDLAIFYPHPQEMPAWWLYLISLFVLAALTGIAVHLRHNRPCWTVGWFWYVGTLIPVIGLVQVGYQSMADRYTYVPLLGIFLALTWSLPRTVSEHRLRVVAGGALVLGALGLAARLQVGTWRDISGLYRHALQATTGNWLAHNNLGVALAIQRSDAEAHQHFVASIAFNPNYRDPRYNLAKSLEHFGRDNEAIREYREALRIDPGFVKARYNLGNLLDRVGRAEEAIQEYREALRIDPGHFKAHYNLGIALARQGRIEEAAASYMRAIEIDPSHSQALVNLGMLYWGKGSVLQAHDLFARAVRSDTGNAAAHFNLGLALSDLGRREESRHELQEALRLDPSLEAARMVLGRLPP